jgi:hypothetical protein
LSGRRRDGETLLLGSPDLEEEKGPIPSELIRRPVFPYLVLRREPKRVGGVYPPSLGAPDLQTESQGIS